MEGAPDLVPRGTWCHDGGQDTRQLTATDVVLRVDNDYLGENPGGTLGTVQANPCCWLTPTGP